MSIAKMVAKFKKINFEKLTSYPNYLEENKICIDQWINEILFSNLVENEA